MHLLTDNDHKNRAGIGIASSAAYKTSMCMNELLIPSVYTLIWEIQLLLDDRKLVRVNDHPITDASLSSAVNRNIRAGS